MSNARNNETPSKSDDNDFEGVEKRHPFLIWFILILALLLVALGFYQFFRITTTSTDERTQETIRYLDDEKEMVTIKLFYYNKEADREIAEYLPGSPEAILPVKRTIPDSDNIIAETIHLLLREELSEEEKEEGFTTEFPGPGFRLIGAELENGQLVLIFEDPERFTVGGSMRTGIMAQQIQKTALQFDEVEQVLIQPEELFQP